MKKKSSFVLSNGIKVTSYDRYIFGIIKRNYLISEKRLLQLYPSFQLGILKGSLSRLKQAQWIVLVPSLDGYMTRRDYYARISDDMADDSAE